MTHFGIFCPGALGHLNPMCNLGRELLRRGHSVTLFGVPDVRAKVTSAGIAFGQIGAREFPSGSLEATYRTLGKMDGLAGLKFSIDFFKKETKMLFSNAPEAVCSAGIDALIIDQTSLAVGTIADHLKIPFVTVCNALLINREPSVPPYFTNWPYQTTPWAILRNRAGNALLEYLTRPIWQMITRQRQQWKLPPYPHREAAYSQLAQICQLPAVFDFPRQRLPQCLHYVGPLSDPQGSEPITFDNLSFPFEQLTGQPLVYASLGTLQNRNWTIFQTIAAACLDLDVQLVISLGNPSQDTREIDLPGTPIVVAYAPHQQLISRSALVITHAGMNTVIGALSYGVPLIAIPITNEQPGIAARMARTGAGKVVPLKKLTAPKLRAAIVEVLHEKAYRENAAKVKAAIQSAGGVSVAVDIIERALT